MTMYQYASWRSDPSADPTALGDPAFRIMRNGKVYAYRQSLGAARSLVRNTIRDGATGDVWMILNSDGTDVGIEFEPIS